MPMSCRSKPAVAGTASLAGAASIAPNDSRLEPPEPWAGSARQQANPPIPRRRRACPSAWLAITLVALLCLSLEHGAFAKAAMVGHRRLAARGEGDSVSQAKEPAQETATVALEEKPGSSSPEAAVETPKRLSNPQEAMMRLQPARPVPSHRPSVTDSEQPLISQRQFFQALRVLGYDTAKQTHYEAIIKNAKQDGGITTKRELAMFLAQIIWESMGLRYKVELACVETGCPEHYNSPEGIKGKRYYGRGYIQLTWAYNYKAASLALFGDDRLLKDPDMVAANEDIAWKTAFWYWKANVHSSEQVQKGWFGATTLLINGGLECGNHYKNGRAVARFEHYKKIMAVFGLTEVPNPAGCGGVFMKNETTDNEAKEEAVDGAAVDEQSTDKQSTDKQSTDKQSTDKQPADKQSTDKQSTDKQSTDKQSTDKQSTDKQSTDGGKVAKHEPVKIEAKHN